MTPSTSNSNAPSLPAAFQSRSVLDSLRRHFATHPDARMPGRVKHLLADVLLIAFIAIVSDCDTFTDIGDFARDNFHWLSSFMPMKHGPPSHDTFRNVFLMVKPTQFVSLLQQWAGRTSSPRIMIDGKSLRGSDSPAAGLDMIHTLRAWVGQSGISVGHEPCREKSNEIDALPRLLQGLDLQGALVSMDAAGTYPQTADTLTSKGALYILALKKNQPEAYETAQARYRELDAFFARHQQLPSMVREFKSVTMEHGRYVERTCQVTDLDGDWFKKDWKWAGLTGVVRLERRCHRGGGQKEDLTCEVHYFLTSSMEDAEKIAGHIREHWQVENSCHHILDVTFREDDSQVRDRRAAGNLTIMRELALKALRDYQPKQSVRSQRKRASRCPAFREAVLDYILHNFNA